MPMKKLLVCLLFACACGGDDADGGPPSRPGADPDAGGGSNRCIDEDNDGFGYRCDAPDCDDEDPTMTDECYRCAKPAERCPCEKGTMPAFCVPPKMEVEGGVLVCEEGAFYCREGAWSACEAVGAYVFVPTGS
jgi:hypothetical protein